MNKLRELLEKQEDLQREIEEVRKTERANALVECLQLIADFHFTAQELKLVKVTKLPPVPAKKSSKTFKPSKSKSSYPPKYRNPATGQTWSGRGHEPGWMKGHRDDFVIKDAALQLKEKFTSVHAKKGQK